jgi:2-polyprenyl-3-methyl-5-hydroxy-6-metoxy-1,4-benzoquinol methylase
MTSRMAKDYSIEIDLSVENSSYTKLVAMCGRDKKVLDVGCSSGHLSRALAERGCVVSGVDINGDAARRAAETCDRVVVGDLDLIELTREFEGAEFDVILFGDVLEHLKSPQKTLNAARELLAPGGFIGLSVPNIAHTSIRLMLLKGEFNYQDMGILDDTHLRFYTRKSLRDLVESCGYIVDHLDWTEYRIPEEQLREAFDPLCLNDISAIIEKFASPESVAFQYVIKAFPATEQAQVKRMSEEKVKAEQRVAELERDIATYRKIAEAAESVRPHYEKTIHAYHELEQEIARRSEHLRALEEQAGRHGSDIAARDTRIRELEELLACCREETWQARSDVLRLREELNMRLTARLRRRLEDRGTQVGK